MISGHALSSIVQCRHCITYFPKGHCDESAMLARTDHVRVDNVREPTIENPRDARADVFGPEPMGWLVQVGSAGK